LAGVVADMQGTLRRPALAPEAAQGARRVLEVPAPHCVLMNFGDSIIDLELRS
jgi:small-conductance mechanosensitive channel